MRRRAGPAGRERVKIIAAAVAAAHQAAGNERRIAARWVGTARCGAGKRTEKTPSPWGDKAPASPGQGKVGSRGAAMRASLDREPSAQSALQDGPRCGRQVAEIAATKARQAAQIPSARYSVH